MKKAIIFPGQGSQAVGMGKDLYSNFDYVKDVFHEVDEVMGHKLSNIIFEGPETDLTITSNTQPALMTVSIALLKVLAKEFNLSVEKIADCVAGHSLGEYTALCAVDSISLADCAKILKVRGNAMMEAATANPGAMAAIIGATPEMVAELATEASVGEGNICVVANDNSTGQIVLSGTISGIDKAIELAGAKGIKRAIKLPVSGAFHSPLMESAREKLGVVLEDITFSAPTVPVIANVTASPMAENEIKALLLQQLTGSVRFRESLIYMQSQGISEYTEIGAGKVLTGLVKKTLNDVTTFNVSSLETINEFTKTI